MLPCPAENDASRAGFVSRSRMTFSGLRKKTHQIQKPTTHNNANRKRRTMIFIGRLAPVRSGFPSKKHLADNAGDEIGFALVVVLDAHGAVVADDIIKIRAEMDGSHLPRARSIFYIRFGHRLVVYV